MRELRMEYKGPDGINVAITMHEASLFRDDYINKLKEAYEQAKAEGKIEE